ncbi:CDP-alcohol phosphatidyltransferase family protein [Parachlamydia sp. AcF125]|uniref:CDP-alcohol phosphatidyltransferase family protein n=1 Tax=Parachlamydia sp. AcF125 TaxID=2795736 RepID=UPI001BC9006A|nr:CDP-alcohol phosphatidyltransferase family protein [Parachlamydia sp. AcF125]MBS4167987.1 CDP-diacylglycerol--glycerol-3-phosphate 3-phosphatidyltransferase [Parachlamydia sp. AcF125]
MFTLPNLISLTRIPLALVFLQENIFYRIAALILAMLSDALDGYYARRYHLCSQIGTMLDPLMDKLFVIFIISILVQENAPVTTRELVAFFCRDLAVITYTCYLIATNRLSQHRVRSIWCGKISTFLQFLVLIALSLQIPVPPIAFSLFLLLGVLALFELYFYSKTREKSAI